MLDKRHYDRPTVLVALFFILTTSIVLYRDISSRQLLVFIVGTGIGLTLIHSGFGFTGAWRVFITRRQSLGIRAQIILFAIASIVMFPLVAGVFSSETYSAALGPIAFSVLFGAFLFGIGMQLGGGCGSGTLSTSGQGQIDMLLTIVFFIVGSYIGTMHLDWWISFANLGTFSFIKSIGWIPALTLQLTFLIAIYMIVRKIDIQKNGAIEKLALSANSNKNPLTYIFGDWPILWGSILLALLAISTLLLTGHTWSITFAFGLWGAKIWQALGGNPELSLYWSSGYPARALNSSVLTDVTSVMNMGILLGAMLAAALANKFSPPMVLNYRRMLTAVLGGLLLGYGARLAFGCNIGALLAGITTGSAHAWVWLLGGATGNVLGIKLRLWLEHRQRV